MTFAELYKNCGKELPRSDPMRKEEGFRRYIDGRVYHTHWNPSLERTVLTTSEDPKGLWKYFVVHSVRRWYYCLETVSGVYARTITRSEAAVLCRDLLIGRTS